MRLPLAALVLFFAAIPFAGAQVINGESTYEDNFHHTPPDPPRTEPSSPVPKQTHRQPAPTSAEPSAADAPPY